MNIFGLHTFAIAPVWDLARIEPQIDRLKEYGIGLLEIPLLRPEEIDTKRIARLRQPPWRRARAARSACRARSTSSSGRTRRSISWRRLSGSAPRSAASALGGVTYGTIGKTTGRGADAARRSTASAASSSAPRKQAKSYGDEARHRALQPLRDAPHQPRQRCRENHRAGRRGKHLHPSRHLPHAYRGGEFCRRLRGGRALSRLRACLGGQSRRAGQAACSTGRRR